ncbi:MAG: 2,3,4,5-tetrahydropyridine-2-carboxylate N-succinyltransferase [Halieaceae bacterium]|jgi:2,3,4,5-tetrahydropyridine-2-carboxylate N-succinyltransferase
MMSNSSFALGLGTGTKNANDEWLEIYFQQPLYAPDQRLMSAMFAIGYEGGNSTIPLSPAQMLELAAHLSATECVDQACLATALASTDQPLVAVVLEVDTPPTTVPEGYLKLHLISHRLLKPHQTNLDGLFGVLPNVAWTSEGAISVDELPTRQLAARLKGEVLEVSSVDKFPKMTNYVVPSGVRIAHTARVRLGAYLGEGTTVMHEGFVNFNAGTEGPGMIEGRISAGVMVGAGSDVGGSGSIMGTLSGGGNLVNSLGDGCLIGANAGTGIPLGDYCTIEAGLYITAGTKVVLLDEHGHEIETTAARNLAGQSNLLFRRHSITGTVQCLRNRSAIELNDELHAHN